MLFKKALTKAVGVLVLLGLSAAVSAKVNINTATVEELSQLKNIGEVKAKAIVEYRESNGDFAKIEDIVLVKGIGEGIFSALKEDLSVEGETSFEDVQNLK